MTVQITLPFPPSVNNLFINGIKGRIRSQRYHEWATEAGWELKRQRPPSLKGQVTLHYEFQEGHDNRKRDIGNLEKATTDLLVEHGVIVGDDNSIVREITLRWSREVKGVRITIEPAADAIAFKASA